MKKRSSIALGLVLLAAFALPGLRAQEADKNLTLNLLFGYRAVDTSGAADKYKEDFNLEKGVRLFNFQLTYLAPESLKKLFDRVDLLVTNFGGDPFETFTLTAQKYGRYRFRYERKTSAYYYADPRMVTPQTLYDLKTFDFDRLSDSASLTLTVAEPLDLYFAFDRASKTGSSTTSLDLNRVEFEFDQPVSEKLTEFAFGVNVHVPRYALVFERRNQDFENSNSYFLPGYADGGPGARYPSSLTTFALDQPYSFATEITSFRVNARPLDSLLFRGTARWSSQETDLAYAEEALGLDYLGTCFEADETGRGHFMRDMELYDADLTFLLSKRLAVVGSARYGKFTQEGSLSIGTESERTSWIYDRLGVEGGLQFLLSSKFVLTAGARYENRMVDAGEMAEEGFEDFETVRTGFFGNLKWDLFKALKLTFDYQRSDVDDPYTLVAPTQFDRFRATLRTQLKNFTLTANVVSVKVRNELEGGLNFRVITSPDDASDVWTSSNTQFNLRLGYRTASFDAGVGYAMIKAEQKSDREIAFNPFWTGPAGTFPWMIDTTADTSLFDVSFSWAFRPAWRAGAYLNSYKNTGFWPVERTMVKASVEHTFGGGFVGQFGYRYVDFKEKDSKVGYKANILEFSFGYRWE